MEIAQDLTLDQTLDQMIAQLSEIKSVALKTEVRDHRLVIIQNQDFILKKDLKEIILIANQALVEIAQVLILDQILDQVIAQLSVIIIVASTTNAHLILAKENQDLVPKKDLQEEALIVNQALVEIAQDLILDQMIAQLLEIKSAALKAEAKLKKYMGQKVELVVHFQKSVAKVILENPKAKPQAALLENPLTKVLVLVLELVLEVVNSIIKIAADQENQLDLASN